MSDGCWASGPKGRQCVGPAVRPGQASRTISRAPKVRHFEASIKDVARVEVDCVSPKQLKEFLLKVSLLMMLILIADVFNDRPFHGFTYTEGSISILPAKESSIGECLANPARGIAFCGIDQIGDGGCRRHRNVQVNVVRSALGPMTRAFLDWATEAM
jgi:hypothetical protein